MNIDLDSIAIQLNSGLGIINLFLSFVVAGATLVYSILTWKLTNETKRMREVYTEPRVSVTVEENCTHEGFFDIIVKNIGFGPAYDIKFIVNEGCVVDGVTLASIRRLSVLTNGILYLGPSQIVKSNISYCHNNESFFETSFDISAAYKSSLGKQYVDKYMVKFSEFEGIAAVSDPLDKDVRNSVKRIADLMENISDGRKEIRVIVQTAKNKDTAIKNRILSNRDYIKE